MLIQSVSNSLFVISYIYVHFPRNVTRHFPFNVYRVSQTYAFSQIAFISITRLVPQQFPLCRHHQIISQTQIALATNRQDLASPQLAIHDQYFINNFHLAATAILHQFSYIKLLAKSLVSLSLWVCLFLAFLLSKYATLTFVHAIWIVGRCLSRK